MQTDMGYENLRAATPAGCWRTINPQSAIHNPQFLQEQ
jgi:hypothetical protein